MRYRGLRAFALLPLFASAVMSVAPLSAQGRRWDPARPRITRVADNQHRITLANSVHPSARLAPEAGIADANRRMEQMMLSLRPSAEAEHELEQFLVRQHDPESADYQRWLSPEEFGLYFGVSEFDIRQLTSWLESQGFTVSAVPAGRRLILFSGTVEQVDRAFHARMRNYDVAGKRHLANSADAEIPEAFADVVAGIVSLHDFTSAPQHVVQPQFTAGGSHYLGPADFATIYDVVPLHGGAINGAGQTIAVIGRTNIKLADVTDFRNKFGLPAKDPKILLTGSDPGIVNSGEQMEATLDVEWAAATAPGANVTLVVAASTASSDGIALSSQYAVNNNVAPVLTVSYGACEAAMGRAGTSFWDSLWQQAAAQGQTVLVASGDSGAAGCDEATASAAHAGAGVNALCSSPYSTCVGGTQFLDVANPSTYWSAQNGAGYGSALSYIPEQAWNETASGGLWSTGGGASLYFSKPVWQTGTGVPADGKRDVPDVSLTAAAHDGYVVVINGQTGVVAGTSASAPALAGLMALAVQKTAARIGNANPTFYALAARQAAGGASVFHDVTSGTNTVPGQQGFNAGAGYDLATGLGSVDALVMVNNWGSQSATPSMQLTAKSATVSASPSGTASVALAVAASGGFNSSVTLSVTGMPTGVQATLSPATLTGSGSSSLNLTVASSAAAGSYPLTVTATGGNLRSTAAVTLTISAPCSYTLAPSSASVGNAAAGYSAQVTTATGCAWTAVSNTSWITVGTSNGTGGANVAYSVAANTQSASRTGTVVIGGKTLTVVQDAAATYTVSPLAVSAEATATAVSITVTPSPTTAGWTAASSATWITISSGASATGKGTVAISIAANTGSAQRTGTLLVAGQTVTVTQAAPVSLTLSATSVSMTAAGGTGSVNVQAQGAWAATTAATWITITAGATGSGNGKVNFSVAPNTSSSRSGTITIGGQALTVTQAGSTCTYSIGTVSVAPQRTGVDIRVPVVTQAGCGWTATTDASWLQVTSGSPGKGSGVAVLKALTNTTRSARSATISIGPLRIKFTQGS